MQDDNRKTKTKVDFINKFLTKEQQELRLKNMRRYLGMSDVETHEKTIKEIVLSDYDKEEIFFVRWFTFIVSTLIVVPIWIIFFNLNGFIAFTIIVLNIFIPPLYYFRKSIGGFVKENISYWWSMLKGRIP